ncbi:hypothetical protein N7G274_010455 [Stereocaulon virgatum]|uniref:Uncharacterized protein n=1 Tax=Stereocaulon virgatum TaxID=373712 RepID=A0ABR3ZXK3_9LECA
MQSFHCSQVRYVALQTRFTAPQLQNILLFFHNHTRPPASSFTEGFTIIAPIFNRALNNNRQVIEKVQDMPIIFLELRMIREKGLHAQCQALYAVDHTSGCPDRREFHKLKNWADG